MKIGLISDTHDHLDERVAQLFAGVDRIVHAGDVGRPWILLHLEQVAPVTAVKGNNDPLLPLPDTEIVEWNGTKLLVHHIVSPIGGSLPIHKRIRQEAPHVVVYGHTHIAHETRMGPTWFVNPGYAGKPRFNQPRSVAILHLTPELRVEFISL